MPRFAYRAKKGPTEVVNGTIDAQTADAVIEKLDEMGLLPIRMEEVSADASAPAVPALPAGQAGVPAPAIPAAAKPRPDVLHAAKKPLFARIRSTEVTIFGRQLASLLRAGVPILKALWIISEQTPNPKFKEMLEHSQDEIRNGKPLSAVLSQYPRLFPPIYLAMVRTGEDSGTLQEVLVRISEYRQKQEEIGSRVRSALAYPILMGLTGIGTVAFMLTFVIPRLTGLFSQLGTALPLPTRILMSASAVFQSVFFWLAAAALIIGLTVLARTPHPKVRRMRGEMGLRFPLLGPFALKAELARLCRTLELLVKSGLPILRGLEITAPVIGNSLLREAFEEARAKVSGGASLGRTLRESGRFPLFLTNLVSVGEESGKLDEALAEAAAFYERETDEGVRLLTSLLEPLMILVMGLIVGFIVMAMLLPMFELNLAVG